jgi:hypothetical protein
MIKSRRMRWTGHVARMRKKRNAYVTLVGKPEGKSLRGRLGCRREDNIKIDLIELGWGSMDWIDLPQDRDQFNAFVNTIMNLQVPQSIGKFMSCCVTGGFSRRLCSMELIS